VIRIMDNGIGLPPDRARLFEPYVTTREKGTGLGLPIVKKIIEEHGGTLASWTRPAFDGNAHPAPWPKSACRGSPAADGQEHRAALAARRLRVMSILIVDDERDIRELIGDILKDEGYTTRLAEIPTIAWPRSTPIRRR
jgi:signal transduction histidine kinase